MAGWDEKYYLQGHKDMAHLREVYAETVWCWARIETELFQIFHVASGGTNPISKTLRTTFFAVKGFEIRLSMTDAVATAKWSGTPHFAEWKALQKKLNDARRIRGRIAHKAGQMYFTAEGDKPLVALVDPLGHENSPMVIPEIKNRGITIEQLEVFRKDWEALRIAMRQLQGSAYQAQLQASISPRDSPAPDRGKGDRVQTPSRRKGARTPKERG